MSYILDALVKADQERQRQSVPGLNTLQAGSWSPPGLRLPWPVAAAGGGLAVAGFFLIGAHWWPQPAMPAVKLAALPADSALAVRPPAKSETVQVAIDPPAQEPVLAPTRAPSRPAAQVAKPPSAPRPEPVARLPKPENRLYDIAELPATLQKEAQNLAVAGIAQASGADERMAIINDRALREGDEVKEGLRVERISSHGVVFNLRGYRFRKGGA